MAKTAKGRVVRAASKEYTARTEYFQGREHLVVPVVALVEGVVHAMNSAHPELVTAEEYSYAPGGWNGRPLFLGHPERGGEPVSGNSPALLEEECIGIVFNAAVRKRKLTMEAWIDVARATEIAPELLKRVQDRKPIEISVGVFVETDEEAGVYEGKEYLGAWHDIVPDHLALLPAGDEGACSVDMGCGVRAAKETAMDVSMYSQWLEAEQGATGAEALKSLIKTLRNIPQSVRDGMAKEDFAGPSESFPIQEPIDVHDAAASLGRAKGNRNEIKRKIIAIAYRKGDTYVAQLPDGWKHKADQKAASRTIMQRIAGLFRASQNADEMSGDDLMRRLYDALRDVESNLSYVQTYHPVTDPAHVVYCCWIPSAANGFESGMGYQSVMYERAFELSDTGVVTLNAARIEVEPVMRYEPVEGAQPLAASAPKNAAAAGAPCSCQHENAPLSTQERTMTKTERVKALIAKATKMFTPEDQAMLEAATEAQLVRFETAAAEPAATTAVVAETVAAVVVPAAVAAVAVAAADVQDPKKPTLEDLIGSADADTQDMFNEGRRLGAEKRTKTIEALKKTGRCSFTDVELKAMRQSELDRLVALAGSNVREAIDYSGLGGPKDLSANAGEVPDAPSLDEALKADRAAKK